MGRVFWPLCVVLAVSAIPDKTRFSLEGLGMTVPSTSVSVRSGIETVRGARPEPEPDT